MFHLPGMNVHAAPFGAAMQLGYGLAGVEQPARIECGLHFVEACEFGRGELAAHLPDLFDADAVFAGDGAADLDAEFEDAAAEVLGLFQFARHVGVEQDERMQIAVAGMEHVGDAQAAFGTHLGDARQHMRQLLARDRAVHAVVVGREPAHRRKGGLAPGPEPEALRLVLGGTDFGCAGGLEYRVHGGDVVRHLLVHAVNLAQQQRLDHGVAGVDEGFGRLDGEPVHHLEPGGDHAGGDDVADRRAGLRHVVEGGEHHLRAFGPRQQFHRDFGDHGEHAFRARHQRQQVVAGRVRRLAADFQQLAVHGERAQRHHVVHGEAVFQAVHAAGILGHVAADRAGDLRRGIGCVVEAVLRGGLGDREIAHAGLHHGGACERIDALDAVQLGQHQQHCAVDRQRAGREAGAGAARDDCHALGVAQPENGGDLVLGFRQHDHVGRVAVGGQSVRFEGHEVFALDQQAVGGHKRAQAGDENRTQHGAIRENDRRRV